MTEEDLATLEHSIAAFLRDYTRRTWSKRLRFDEKVKAIRDPLRFARSVGLIRRFRVTDIRPRQSIEVDGRKLRFPKGGARVRVVTSAGYTYHDFTLTVVFP